MFKGKDPRADLFAAASKPPATGLVAEQQLARFYDQTPQVSGEGTAQLVRARLQLRRGVFRNRARVACSDAKASRTSTCSIFPMGSTVPRSSGTARR